MWHILDTSAKQFCQMLEAADQAHAERVRQRGCPHCGGRLHHADYPRKPRGVPEECERHMNRRISFCCREPGCRRRSTPPSLRFLWRRVYVAAVMYVVSAGWVSAEAARVPKRTARRWRTFFTRTLVESMLWQQARAWFRSPLDEAMLPDAMLERFPGSRRERLFSGLDFLATQGARFVRDERVI